MKLRDKETDQGSTLYVLILGLLTTLGPFTIDLYVPAFPQIRNSFGISDGFVQLTLAGTTIGFALGQFFVGILSDRIGRRKPLLFAAVLHVAASIGCALSTDIYMLCLLRVLQGVGAASSAVVVRAIIRDQFEGNYLSVMLSRIGFVTTLTPILAPVLGAELLVITGWRGIFWLLAAFSTILFILTFCFVRETYPAEVRNTERVPMRHKIKILLSDRLFVGATLTGAMVYAAVYAYVAASPILFQSVYGFTPRQFSFIFLLNSLGLALGIRINIYLLKFWQVQTLLVASLSAMSVAAGCITAASFITSGSSPILIGLWLFIASTGVAFPNASALSLHSHKERAGTAASLYGAFSFTVAGILSPVIGFTGMTSATPVGLMLVAVSLAGMVGAWAINQSIKSSPEGYAGQQAMRKSS